MILHQIKYIIKGCADFPHNLSLFIHRSLIVFFLFTFGNECFARDFSYKTQASLDYIEKYHLLAIQNMYLYKIPASITLAQGIIESSSGRSKLAVNSNNHFGIKCKKGYTGKKFYKRDEHCRECFRKYETVEDSYEDHSIFLSTRQNYAPLFSLDITDYKAWAYGLKKCGYATNPRYSQMLIKVIEDNGLDEFDINSQQYLPPPVSSEQDSLYLSNLIY